ncbi:MAG: S8 family serine peptidase [Deltaproteobacteria bacterium]|nr:S8 family serine peptidase [Deltaproteobacteria bacterium]
MSLQKIFAAFWIIGICFLFYPTALNAGPSSPPPSFTTVTPIPRILVKYRQETANKIEGKLPLNTLKLMNHGGDRKLRTLFEKYRLKEIRPLHPGKVYKKKKTGKSEMLLTNELKGRFQRRSNRVQRNFPTPELTQSYILELDLGNLPMTNPKVAEERINEKLNQLKQEADVEYAERIQALDLAMIPNDPAWDPEGENLPENSLWGLSRIGMEEAWNIETGDGVTVAVVDTGVDYNHADLATNIWTSSSEIVGNNVDDDENGFIDDSRGWDFVNRDNNPIDDGGHGTHVSGTIAGIGNNSLDVIGVAYNSKVAPVKVCFPDRRRGCPFDAVAAGITYAADIGADIINLSLGGPFFSQGIEDAVNYALSLGVVVVTAAGNDYGADIRYFYPANTPGVIVVGATQPNNTRADFSNQGHKLDVVAPGLNILSTIFGGGTVAWDGTSMATPHVVGLAALLISQNPTLTVQEIRQILKSSSDSPFCSNEFCPNLGYGLIRAVPALTTTTFGESLIAAPRNGEAVEGTIEIRGTATSRNFSRYRLEYGEGYSLDYPNVRITWIPISESTTPVTNGVLGTFDMTPLTTEQSYIIRLSVDNQDGTTFYERVGVFKGPIVPPTIQIESPEGGPDNVLSGPITVRGTASDNGEVARVALSFDRDPMAWSFLDATGTTEWSYEWDSTAARDGGPRRIRAVAYDQYGNTTSQDIFVYYNNYPLEVTRFNPRFQLYTPPPGHPPYYVAHLDFSTPQTIERSVFHIDPPPIDHWGPQRSEWEGPTGDPLGQFEDEPINPLRRVSTSHVSYLSPETFYHLRIHLFGHPNEESVSEHTFWTPGEPPTTPTGIEASVSLEPDDTASVTLRWQPATDNISVEGYRIYRDGSLVATATETQFIDTNQPIGIDLTYEVSAIDLAGNESPYSEPVTVRAQYPNLLTNPGFEEDQTDWQFSTGATIDTTTFHSGAKAARLTPSPRGGRQTTVSSLSSIPVTAGHQYYASGWIKAVGGLSILNTPRPFVTLAWFNSSGRLIRAENAKLGKVRSEWQQFSSLLPAPAGAATAQIKFGIDRSGRGTFWFDDLVFRRN